MLSPFPGMDPYLEAPSGWPSVHHRLIGVISDVLTAQLAPHFYVSIEERVYISDQDDPELRQQIAPDVYLVERPSLYRGTHSTTAVITPPTIMEPLPALDVRDRYLEIHDRRNRAVVTTIEIVSPRNKAARSRGRDQFLTKRSTVFATQTHWIEIDLLRAGERSEEVAHKSDYYALLRHAGTGGRLAVWYVDMRDRLPTIAVPLHAPYDDAALDLQAVFDTVYERARYADELDYTAPVPPPALRPATTAWATERIATWQIARMRGETDA